MSEIIERRRALLSTQISKTEWEFGRYYVIHVKECIIEPNNGVTNTANAQTYLIRLSGLPGDFFGFSNAEPKSSYVNNEVVSAYRSSTNSWTCQRFRNGTWGSASWNVASYDARLVPGTKVYVYTQQWLSPVDIDS